MCWDSMKEGLFSILEVSGSISVLKKEKYDEI